jgi:hypothetical protein
MSVDELNNTSCRRFISMFPCKDMRCLLTCEYFNRERIMLVILTSYMLLNVFTYGLSTRDHAPALACYSKSWIIVIFEARNLRMSVF